MQERMLTDSIETRKVTQKALEGRHTRLEAAMEELEKELEPADQIDVRRVEKALDNVLKFREKRDGVVTPAGDPELIKSAQEVIEDECPDRPGCEVMGGRYSKRAKIRNKEEPEKLKELEELEEIKNKENLEELEDIDK